MPGWSKMAAAAHTLLYDLKLLEGTQSGKPLPPGRWAAAAAPTLVVVGGKSEAFFHSGAKQLDSLLPNVKYQVLQGRGHSAVMMAPKDMAAAIRTFFLVSRLSALPARRK